MKNLFRVDSPMMVALSNVADLIILSVLWILCSLPIVTMGSATTALYYMTQNMIRQMGGSVVMGYVKAFFREFRQSTLLFLVLGGLEALLLGASLLLWTGTLSVSSVLSWLSLIPALAVIAVMCYAFPLQARFANTVGQTLKNAAMLALSNPVMSLALVCAGILPVVVLLLDTELFLRTTMLWLLLGPGAIAMLQTFLQKNLIALLEAQSREAQTQSGANQ